MVTIYDSTKSAAADGSQSRHPEKQNRQAISPPPRPPWLRIRVPGTQGYTNTNDVVRKHGLTTVCEEAACPNITNCWTKKHATFMIMGDTCTRACAFCYVKTGLPQHLDPEEPEKIANAVSDLELEHVVITSVDRDDLADGGAQHFANCIKAVRSKMPKTSIEVLVPDFLRKDDALQIVMAAKPDVFNHNIETVPGLYVTIRPGARYFHSLKLLAEAKSHDPHVFTKSGLMVGLGESREEILQVMDDMRCADVDFLTIGQYLQPTPRHAPIKNYVTPEEFKTLERIAYAKGFLMVSATPLTRSSFHAGEDFEKLKAARKTQS